MGKTAQKDWHKALDDCGALMDKAAKDPTDENIRELALWVYYEEGRLPDKVGGAIWEAMYAALPIQAVIKIQELIIDDFKPTAASS